MENFGWPAIAAAALVAFLAANARAVEREPFSVPFKPLKARNVLMEFVWQAQNVIDLDQTLTLSGHPDRWCEVGTMSPLTGPHPSKAQVWTYSLLFGLAHYGVSQLLANYEWQKSLDVWQGASIVMKSANMRRNVDNGLGY